MTTTPDQRNAFEALKEKLPVDLVPGYSVATTGEIDPTSPWVNKMRRFSKDLGVNAFAYFNFIARSKGPLRKIRRTPKKIISPEGFPPWVTVSYAYPPPQAFYSTPKDRLVKHFVFHSFGHGWHATIRDKRAIGWLNSSRGGRGVQPYVFEGRTVYVAKGSDPETLAHFTRFSAGLRACLHSAAKATAHFFIDRAGNLVVIGDCNDVMFTSNSVNKSSCGVELEEAFYVLDNPKGKKNRAIFRSGGRPPGTAGNIQYFAYSPQQLFTLSILVKKLETSYPALKARNISFDRRTFTSSSPAGYTMHDFIKQPTKTKSGKPKGGHFDVSPQFLTQDLWDSFFDLVNTHTHITPANLFRPRQTYHDSGQSLQEEPLSEEALESMTERLFQMAQSQGMAYNRANYLAQRTRKETNSTVGKLATKRAKQETQKVADLQQLSQRTQDPVIDSPVQVPPHDDEGLQVCSDDMW